MRVFFTFLIFLSVCNVSASAQVAGCMDPQATNYNPSATENDGSCTYNATNTSLSNKGTLPAELVEISGMNFIGDKLYAHNDAGPGIRNVIYEIDTTTRSITKAVTLEGTTNVDWEDITNDGTYFYIGDFGNNSNGNRTDLKFYRVPISSITSVVGATGTVPAGDISIINFSYADQTDFTPKGNNSTAFDCEAVIYHGGNLHLFTKNWVGTNTVHYILPASPGTHVAQRMDEFNTSGIKITSATKANDNIVLLLGYATTGFGNCSVWMISAFADIDNLFQTGNKRKIDLGSAAINGQIEGITAVNQGWSLVSNEYFFNDDIIPIEVMQSLRGFSSMPFTPQFVLPFGIENFTSRLTENEVLLTWEYNEPGAAYFEVEAANSATGSYSYLGKVYSNPTGGTYSFTDNNLGNSAVKYYRIKIVSPDGENHYSKTLQVKKDESKLFNLLAMPSPFTSSLNISFYSDTDQVIQLSVVDIQGRPIKTRQLQTNRGRYNFTLDELHGLSKGVYFLTARTKSDLFVRKIMKQ